MTTFRHRRFALARYGCTLGLAGALLTAGYAGAAESQPTWPEEGVEDFTLTEASGRTVTRADLLGEPWLASFIFTHCAGPCPVVSRQMELLQKKTEGLGLRLVTFTVDPDRDTPEVLRAYADLYHAEPDRWWFLTGDKTTIFRLIRNSFKMIVDEDPKAPAGFEVIHSVEIMHVNAEGRVVGRYNAQDDVDMARLRRVLGKPADEDSKILADEDERMKRQLAIAKDELIALAEARERAEQIERFAALPVWVRRLPKVNAGLNGLAAVMLVTGLVLIKAGKVEAHKATMISCFLTSTLFLACYLIYHYHAGSRKYGGSGLTATLYYAILVSHVLLAFAVAFMAPRTLYLALRERWPEHRRLALVTLPIWLYVSVTGVIIYWMLYRGPGAADFP